ncbi:MAG: hypothetical protein QOF60_1060 [Actinomycetota bacterium]|jgi:hypothetical protein|nr:hypothetical protein [Actinomycetota bacterium]
MTDTAAVTDVYLLALVEPFESPEHPVPISAVIVHALTLLHPDLPQPDGGMMYRCMTEFPGRASGSVVPLSTLTFELDGGALWPVVAEWSEVIDAVVHLGRSKRCDALMLGLSDVALLTLASGPATTLNLYGPEGRSVVGGDERQQHIEELTGYVRDAVAKGQLWPGDNLVAPPADPPTMPYKPYHS